MPNDVLTPAIDALASGRSLSQEQAAAVLREIMGDQATEVEIAGFLIALRTKGETEEELEVSATGGGVLMGIRHKTLPAEGVQFHPESILTPEGKKILENFLQPSSKGQTPG